MTPRRVLVIYYSLTGQTLAALTAIAQALEGDGHAVDLCPIEPEGDRYRLPYSKLRFFGEWALAWVRNFPLFEQNADGSWTACHHMFTQPRPEDVAGLEEDPGRGRAQLYDLVCNGVELGSGSIRIHQRELQERVFRIVGMPEEEYMMKFGFFLDALGYGAPHFPLANHYNPDGEEWMYGNLAHEKLIDSGDWREELDLRRHRYMREDVAAGLALLVSVADWAGVDCPVARGLLALGSAVCGENFRTSGRTLENLGLANYSRAQMNQMLTEGL